MTDAERALARIARANALVADLRPQATAEQLTAARAEYQNDDVEIDDDAVTSVAEDRTGVWVSAWVWVAAE